MTKCMRIYEAMEEGISYPSSLPLPAETEMSALINRALGTAWSGSVEGIMKPLVQKGLVSKTKRTPSRLSAAYYTRLPRKDPPK